MADNKHIPFDQSITDPIFLNILTAKKPGGPAPELVQIPIQFPPKITDNKSTKWDEEYQGQYEPVVVYKGAEARKISAEFTFIATGSGGFTAENIAEYMRQIRGVMMFSVKEGIKFLPRVYFELWDIVPSAASFRLLDSNVSYGDTIIRQNEKVYPLKTVVNLSLALVTKIGDKIHATLSPMIKEWY